MRTYFSLVTFSHTIFALPFALTGFTLGVVTMGAFSWKLLLLVLGCMVTARNAAMGFNRYLDRDIDALNPRTASRDIPAGRISASNALAFVAVNALLFMMFTFFINLPCFFLSPVALAVVLGYSYTKRFTWLCHLVLGLGLSLAPVGAFLAVTGRFDLIPILYGAAVMTWVAGFDVIYALQDDEFDRTNRLYSIPAFFGRSRGLLLSNTLHLLSATIMILASWFTHQQYPQAGILLWIATAMFLGLLAYQHSLVRPDDLSRVNKAFFTTNGVASLLFGLLAITDLLT